MVRAVSVGGTSLPISDGTISFNRDPLVETGMNGLGGEQLYSGVYNSITGSFSGAYRPAIFDDYFDQLLNASQTASNTIIVVDDFGNGVTAATCAITSGEISVKAGDYAKCTFNWVGGGISSGGSASAGDYSSAIPVFYNSSLSIGTCTGFSIRVEKPWSADDFIIGNSFNSQSVYQSGDTKVTGTVTLNQSSSVLPGTITSMTFALSSKTITVSNAVLTGINESISGRSLIQKTYNWACPSTGISI